MLLAMAVVVLKVIALVFQRIEGLVFDFPPGASPSHERIHVALTHTEVSDPTEVLALVLPYLPVLDKIDPHLRVRRIEGDVIEKAKPMYQPGGAVVALMIGDPSGMLRGLDLLEQIGMIPLFDTQDVVQTLRVQHLNVGSIGTQTVFGDNELEVGMILAQLGYKALGGIAFAIILVCSITVHNGLRHERNDGPLIRMKNRGTQHLMTIGDRPIAVDAVQTRGTVYRLGGKILCAIERQEVMAIKKRHGFQRLAALQLPKDALEHRTEHLGRDRVQDGTHMRVAWDPLNPVDGV